MTGHDNWTAEQDAALIAMTKGGMLAREIAQHIEIDAQDIERRVVRLIADGHFDAADAPPPTKWPQSTAGRDAR